AGHIVGVVVAADEHLAGAVEAAAASNAPAIGAEADAEDAARHGEKVRDELGIITDLASNLAKDAIDLRHAIATGRNDVLQPRMSSEGQNAALERARSNRGDVIDETLFGNFGEFDGHVAAAGNKVVALNREGSAEHPIAVRPHLQNLFSGRCLDRAHGVVGAT